MKLNFLIIALVQFATAKDVYYNWRIGWKSLAPDGVTRPVIAVNGQWPPPKIEATVGDRIIVDVSNDLGNETTSLHFHGMYMRGQNHMDGPEMVTQCPIPPGSKFTYDFTVNNQVGTYWWHAHVLGQVSDGLRGPMIIHDPSPPFKYDSELVLTISDWFRVQAPYLVEFYQSSQNVDGAEPIPDSGLLNDSQNITLQIDPQKTYFLRTINTGGFVGGYLEIDDHDLTIVEVDGIYTEPKTVSKLYLSVGQRYGVLLKTKTDRSKNFLIRGQLDTDMFDEVPAGYDGQFVYGVLVYDSKKALPSKTPMSSLVVFDDMDLVPSTANKWDQINALTKVDHQVVMNVDFASLFGGINRAVINEVTYVHQKVPTLYTALSAGKLATNPAIYGNNSNAIVVKKGEVVEIVLNNFDDGHHPFHLHGQTFQVIERSAAGAGPYPGGVAVPKNPRPLRRDIIKVLSTGYTVLRFVADNPGVHLFHCHIEFHVAADLTATFIVEPLWLQQNLHIPSDHLDACRRQGIPTTGNAAGKAKNYLDLTGAPTEPNFPIVGAVIDPKTLGPPGRHGAKWPPRGKHWNGKIRPHKKS